MPFIPTSIMSNRSSLSSSAALAIMLLATIALPACALTLLTEENPPFNYV